MAPEVYANSNAIACKAGDDKVLAAFPDVCLSPPSPPAGPIPVPYPNTSFSKDMQSGSKTVMIGGKEVMLKDQSFYKTSPLGDEAATNSFGASVVTHVITGKTYFNAWSMDIVFEGQNVDRHKDLTTSNHASYPGGPPMNALEKEMKEDVESDKCPCCKGESHVKGEDPPPQAMSMRDWYLDTNNRKLPANPTPAQTKAHHLRMQKLNQLLRKTTPNGRKQAGCYCDTLTPKNRKREVAPQPPCNVFFQKPTDPSEASARTDKIEEEYKASAPEWKEKMGIDQKSTAKGRQGNHLTPKSAGGCPGSAENDGNLQAHNHLCDVCKQIDNEFSEFQ